MGAIKEISAHTYIGDYGQMVDAMWIVVSGYRKEELESVKPKDFTVEKNYHDLSGKSVSAGIRSVEVIEKSLEESNETCLVLQLYAFVYQYNFTIHGKIGKDSISITKDSIRETIVKDIDKFHPYQENGVKYRMYEPECMGARPLVLFLHGGGESGEDNCLQLTGTIGALHLAERWSDMYIMAPQAPSGNVGMQEMFERMKKRGNPFKVDMGITPFSLKGERGWNRDYIGKICDIVRKLVEEGRVDAKRVYLIGMSMGGGGVLQTLSVAPDLFAAAVPICPSMNGESYAELLSLPKVPAWIATAYIDHQQSRHAYLLEACNKLWLEGRKDVKFTLFTQDELAAYGIGTTENLTMKELLEENHCSWILVLHNERGILDWMISHQKES